MKQVNGSSETMEILLPLSQNQTQGFNIQNTMLKIKNTWELRDKILRDTNIKLPGIKFTNIKFPLIFK